MASDRKSSVRERQMRSWLQAWNAVVAELAGTFLFFFVGIGAVATLDRAAGSGGGLDPAAGLIVVALAHGVVLAVLVSALGAVSGGHFNPAVTFGVWLAGKMPWRRGLAYVVAQLIGGLLAAWSLRLVFPATVSATLGTPALSADISPGAGILIEAVITLILVTVVFGTAIDPRGPKIGGLAIGFALAAGILVAGPLTGGAANPARWFGPAAVTGLWDNWYVWIAGPLIGGGIAALAYRYLFAPEANQAPAG
jgi:MIP family channel proteins